MGMHMHMGPASACSMSMHMLLLLHMLHTSMDRHRTTMRNGRLCHASDTDTLPKETRHELQPLGSNLEKKVITQNWLA